MYLTEFFKCFEKHYEIKIDEKKKRKVIERGAQLEYSEYQLTKLKNYLCSIGSQNPKLLQTKINDMIEAVIRQNDGAINENLFYALLFDHGIPFEEQVSIEKDNCLKSKNGYKSDGCLAKTLYFDVKSFGLSSKMIAIINQKLQQKFPKDFITVSGNKDVNVSIYEKTIKDISKIADALNKQSNIKHDVAGYKIQNAELVVHRYIGYLDENDPKNRKRESVCEISEANSAKWAKNNEFYPLKHGSQFVKNNPFILVYPFKKQDFFLFSEDSQEYFYTFRFLARRIFLHLGKNSKRDLIKCDKDAEEGVSVKQAISYLSGILFWNIDNEWDYSNNQMWLYCNPNAKNSIPRHVLASYFRYINCHIDNFEYDKY